MLSSSSTATTNPTAALQQQQQQYDQKARLIHAVLMEPIVDLWKLRDLALSKGGLVNDSLRKAAWPKLVGLTSPQQEQQDVSQPRQSSTTTTTSTTTVSSFTTMNNSNDIHNTRPSFEFDTTGTSLSDDRHTNDEHDTRHQDDSNNNKKKASSFSHLSVPPSPPPLPLLVKPCLDAEQIERDVARCTWHLLTGTQRSRRAQIQHKTKSKKVVALLKRKQRKLANLINLTLVQSSSSLLPSVVVSDKDNDDDPVTPTSSSTSKLLRYYQGYHDVACIFLHALGGGARATTATTTTTKSYSTTAGTYLLTEQQHDDPLGLDLTASVLGKVSNSHLVDFCQDSFAKLQTALQVTLYPLLGILDVDVHNQLQDVDMEPFFCLSWVITWFSHDVRDTQLCKRLFDAFLASHPSLVIYMSIAMLLHPYNRQCILQADCDFATLHHILANLPRHSCRVGWKKSPGMEDMGGGYVSDHETENNNDTTHEEAAVLLDDDQTASTDLASSMMASSSIAPSMTSMSMGGGNGEEEEEEEEGDYKEDVKCKVPFEELLDMAIGYMAKYPPRSLSDLAKRYYAESSSPTTAILVTPMADKNNNDEEIALLRPSPPPSHWQSFAVADWVWKQKWRQDHGLPATNRKDRRKKRRHKNSVTPAQHAELEAWLHSQKDKDKTKHMDLEYLKHHAKDRAVIAAGFGPGPEARLAQRRQRQRLGVAIAMGFLSMSIGMALYYYSSSSPSSPSLAPLRPVPSSILMASSCSSSSSIEESTIMSVISTNVPGMRSTMEDTGVDVLPENNAASKVSIGTPQQKTSLPLSTSSESPVTITSRSPVVELRGDETGTAAKLEAEGSTERGLLSSSLSHLLRKVLLRPLQWMMQVGRTLWGNIQQRLLGTRSRLHA